MLLEETSELCGLQPKIDAIKCFKKIKIPGHVLCLKKSDFFPQMWFRPYIESHTVCSG